MQSKTWNEFWGLFLQVDFHRGNPERWTVREKKAQWCKEHLKLEPRSKLLDLGCGDGILDIWLSRMGFDVTAVDRGSTVIKNARAEDDTQKVKFIENDLQKIDFPSETFHAVIIIETLGLMSKAEDLSLLKRTFQWLKPGGSIAVDTPLKPQTKNVWEKSFASGKVVADTRFDEATRIHQLNFEFQPKDEDPFVLEPCITRYIYSAVELKELLVSAGFKTKIIPHYYDEGYVSFIGIKI